MGVKGFVEGGIASIIAGCPTHNLLKVKMQLHGETQILNSAAATETVCPEFTAYQPPSSAKLSTPQLLLAFTIFSNRNGPIPNSGNMALLCKTAAGLIIG
ncbi:hypothetical protein BVC80_8577g9 [Macleaya cordata]|uniref:Uncharacterized protein n=1 Tax=Macleaya cordata TaxID=56857 RepID=A0A200QLW3_MACCD|nr:hypothetical protein BVC80_8577g9 [Macleaya cordata]